MYGFIELTKNFLTYYPGYFCKYQEVHNTNLHVYLETRYNLFELRSH